MKCKAHNQGDRCRRSDGHDGAHDGQFTIWQEGKFREEKCAPNRYKRNRQLDRTLRSFDPGRVNPAMRKQAIAYMERLIARAHDPAQ